MTSSCELSVQMSSSCSYNGLSSVSQPAPPHTVSLFFILLGIRSFETWITYTLYVPWTPHNMDDFSGIVSNLRASGNITIQQTPPQWERWDIWCFKKILKVHKNLFVTVTRANVLYYFHLCLKEVIVASVLLTSHWLFTCRMVWLTSALLIKTVQITTFKC